MPRGQGYSLREAYSKAYHPSPRIKASSLYERANRTNRRPEIKARIRDLLRHKKVQDLDSMGQAHSDTLEMIDESRSDKNMTAAAALQRQRQQALGMLSEKVVHTIEHTSDAEIIRQLAQGDPRKEQLLLDILGAPSSFDAPDTTPIATQGLLSAPDDEYNQ